jgi:hypothetical protein
MELFLLSVTIFPDGELSFLSIAGSLAWFPAMASIHLVTQVTFDIPSL